MPAQLLCINTIVMVNQINRENLLKLYYNNIGSFLMKWFVQNCIPNILTN